MNQYRTDLQDLTFDFDKDLNLLIKKRNSNEIYLRVATADSIKIKIEEELDKSLEEAKKLLKGEEKK